MAPWLCRAALALALLIGLASASGAESLYRRGSDADPETLDVQKTSTVAEANIMRDLYEGLVASDADGKPIPGVAESWRVSGDGRVYTFALRPNARWSNGDPITASDFVFSYRRIMDPRTGAKYASLLFPIRNAERVNRGELPASELGVAAPHERTLEITLERPVAYFLGLLTHQTSMPVHRASLEQFGADFVRPGNLVSNGAYKLVDFVPNAGLTLEKSPFFHAAAEVRIDKVVYLPHPDLAAAVRRYEAGEIDSLADLPADQIRSLKARFGTPVVLGPSLGVWCLVVNTAKRPFDDARVRQALSLALDRDFIASEIFGGTMLPATSLVPPGIGGLGSGGAEDSSPIDKEEDAKALLAEMGHGPGKPLAVELRFNTSDNNRNTAIAIASMWQAIGVETRLVNTDAKTHFARLRDGGDFDVARYGWIGDYPDPQNFLFLLESGNKGFNSGRWSNPDYDALMRRAETELDASVRGEILREAEAIFVRELPWIPVLFYGTKNLISPKLHGFRQNPLGIAPTRFLWLEP